MYKRRRTVTPRLLALDTEDDSAGQVETINIFDGDDHQTFTGPGMRQAAWAYLNAAEPAHVWACNLEYDLVNVYGDWLGKLVTLQYVSAGLMRGVAREARVQFFDTLRHWPASVAQMAREIGMQKGEPPPGVDYGVWIRGMTEAERIAQCRLDTEIVWRYVSAMLARYTALNLSLRPTLPAMALQLFRTRFYRRPFTRLPADVLTFFREGYYGGRVEVYKLGVTRGPFHHYDVNSLFPSVMAGHRYPALDEWWATTSPAWEREGIAEVTLEYPYHALPGLPVRHTEEILYPYGRLRGTWPYPEIRQALTDGAVIHRVHRAVEFPYTETPFTDYVTFCYGKRQAAESAVDKTFWKLALNSLYGKFGQSNEGAVTIYDDREIVVEHQRLSEHVNVVWSAYVTSYARLALLRHLRGCSEVYYTDTDSLFTPDALPTGPGLGQLKHEGTLARGEFFGNKLYLLTTPEGTETAKAKGVRRSEAARFLRTGRATFRRPARFRESRRGFVTANVWYEVEKAMQTNYTKRRPRRDRSGWTEPWALNEYTRRVSAIRIRGRQP
jgi:hypothetical protein